jgi:integrase
LAEAREKARAAHALLKLGKDPLEHRRAAENDESRHTFRAAADLYLAAHASTWRSAKHKAQWRKTLETYVFPVFGALPVRAVGTSEVMAVLEPIWREKPETASRLRGRIEVVLDYAAARGWRSGENPARWRGHVANLLPRRSKVRAVVHHPALPWRDIASFMADLRGREATAALALEMVVLTAARAGEVLGMRWDEIDMAARVWIVRAKRMKAGREHRIPLSRAAVALLSRLGTHASGGDGFVFPGAKPGRPLSEMAIRRLLERMQRTDITRHGFRSTFRDWCAEATNYPRELAEAALAHALRDKVEAAYQRGDLLERRRRLMEEWADFCSRPMPAAGEVVLLRKA